MAHSRHSAAEQAEMLSAIGVDAPERLFDVIPEEHRFPALDLPEPLSELELTAEFAAIARQNLNPDEVPSFLGAGSYRHFIPATVDYVLRRGEFYTAYTPYQPEISQGMLQAMFEYQTMICRLTGMEVSNASHYDGATSLAEAVLLALAAGKGRRVVMSPSVHPHHRAVVATYLRGADAELVVPDDPATPAVSLLPLLDRDTAALVVQNPNFLGGIEALDGLAEAAHASGALLIVSADPVSLGLFAPPGEHGADVVVADGQPLGLPPSFGGPSLGIFATSRAHVRRLAGRLVGATEDAKGRRGYVLTLATREQHIRRARATSNICTNSALGALAAAVHLATLGEAGLREVAALCHHKGAYAAELISGIPGLTVNPHAPDAPFWREFVVETARPAREVNAALHAKYGIVGGYDLGQAYPGWENRLLLAVTEKNSRAEIELLAEALAEVAA